MEGLEKCLSERRMGYAANIYNHNYTVLYKTDSLLFFFTHLTKKVLLFFLNQIIYYTIRIYYKHKLTT